MSMNAAAFSDKIGTAAWYEKPSFYLLTKNDHALAYEVQQRFAKQINAKTKADIFRCSQSQKS